MANQKKIILQFFSFILKLLYYIVIFFVCLISAFLIYYIVNSNLNADNPNYKPKISLYTIVSPSMNPKIKVYDIVVNIKPDSQKDIEVGDIITYKSTDPNSLGMTITHRVISIEQNEKGETLYTTQGDNNENPDNTKVRYETIIGETKVIIPKIGKIQFLLSEQRNWLFLLIIPVVILIIKDIHHLVELFGLKRRVDKVSGYIETTSIEKKKKEEEARKEQIKKELEEKHALRNSLVKNVYESKGFLEEYTETVIKVDKNRYSKKNKKQKEETIEVQPEETIVRKIEIKEPVKKEKPVIVYEQFEILDTDELTSKIKEYDKKISELDQMLKDLEVVKNEAEKETTFIENDDFLKESKIKVIAIENTKNSKKTKNNQLKKMQDKKAPKKKVEVIELKSLVKNNSVEKINIDSKKYKKKKNKNRNK